MLRRLVYDPTEKLPEDLLVAMFSVYKIYSSEEIEHVALRGISLSLYKGELISCVGPSGSGKTTLLNIMAGLIPPTAGSVYWKPLDADITRFSTSQLADTRKEFLGYIAQIPFLIPHLSVMKNVMLAGMIFNKEKDTNKIKSYARELLERIGISDKAKTSPNKLSSGELQRVALVISLINKPSIVLADEPTGNLDYNTGEQFLDLLVEINETLETAFFIVTHSSQVAKRTQKIVELSDGVLIGLHSSPSLTKLSRTRVLIPDAQNRIFLPGEILSYRPWGFTVEIDRSKIILTPVSQINELDVSDISLEEILCQLCGRANPAKNRFCEHCGSFLSRFKFFVED
ncbi:MAG: ATP-binding cassette domain-containing protein [Promethearchaeota archaeon]